MITYEFIYKTGSVLVYFKGVMDCLFIIFLYSSLKSTYNVVHQQKHKNLEVIDYFLSCF